MLGRNPAGAGRQPASVHQRRSKQALHQTARNGHEPPASRGRMPGPRSRAGGATQGRWAPRPPRATHCLARASSPGRRACAPLRDTGLPPPPLPGRPSTDVVAGSRRKHVGQPVRAGASEPRGGRRRCRLPCARPSGTPGVDALAPRRARSRAAPAPLLRGLDGGRASPRLRILDEVGAELHARADLEITGRPDWSVFIVVLSWFSVRGLGGPPPFILVNRLDFGWFLMLYKRRLSICLPSRNLRFPESSNVEFCAKNVTRTQPRRALGGAGAPGAGAGSRFPRAPGSGTRVGGHPLSAPRLLHVVIQLRRQMILTQHCRFPAEPANTPEPCKAARKYDAGRKR